MKRLFFLLLIMLLGIGAQAQVSQAVRQIVEKCGARMNSPQGVEMDMKVKAGMKLMSMTLTMKLRTKGEKSLMNVSTKLLGREVKSEKGYDGVQEWKYKSGTGSDTLFVSKQAAKSKNDYEIDFDVCDEYRKAALKEKDGLYVITFSEPVDKDAPKRTVMTIRKDNHDFVEMQAKDGPISMRITATKIKYGVSDAVFKFDPQKYPGAIVVRK